MRAGVQEKRTQRSLVLEMENTRILSAASRFRLLLQEAVSVRFGCKSIMHKFDCVTCVFLLKFDLVSVSMLPYTEF